MLNVYVDEVDNILLFLRKTWFLLSPGSSVFLLQTGSGFM